MAFKRSGADRTVTVHDERRWATRWIFC